MDILKAYLGNTLYVYLQMSPYLLFGFFVSGLLYKLIPQGWIQRHLSGNGYSPILKSALFGIPLPLCSCGVIPVMASLRKRGANVPAMLSFLLSTPQTGVDSILATYALLGLPLAIYRPIIALITAVVGGTVYYLLIKIKHNEYQIGYELESSPSENDEKIEGKTEVNPHWKTLLADMANYGFITLPKEIVKPLFIGVLIAGLITTFLPPGLIANFFSGNTLQIIFALLIGIPIYVCATASIPIALGLIHLGVSPGAALAFLISGPATNLATIGVVKKFLGSKALIIYVTTMIGSAFLFGLIFDYISFFYPKLGISNLHLGQFSHPGHIENAGYSQIISSIILTVVFILSLNGFDFSKFLGKNNISVSKEKPDLEFLVEGMSCESCVERVKNILKTIPEVENVIVTLNPQKAIIYGSPSIEDVKHKLLKEGFKVTLINCKIHPPIPDGNSSCSCCS